MPQRTLAIGDIHGCLTQFEALLQAIAPTPNDHIVLLGDYVDRGPNSNGVLRKIIGLSRTHHVTALMGNHEELMLDSRNGFEELRMWLAVGGMAALASYIGPRALNLPAAQWQGSLAHIPPEHWSFLESSLVPYLETESHLFVHASVAPGLPMNQQMDITLRWTSCHDMRPHFSGKTIVCGHTAQPTGKPLNKDHFICLDTHAYAGRFLTCMDTESGAIWQANPQGAVTKAHINNF